MREGKRPAGGGAAARLHELADIPVTAIEDAKNALRTRARDVRRTAHRARPREAAASIRRCWRAAAAAALSSRLPPSR